MNPRFPRVLPFGRDVGLVAHVRESVRHVREEPVPLEDDRGLLLAERLTAPAHTELVVCAGEAVLDHSDVEVDSIADAPVLTVALLLFAFRNDPLFW